MEICSICPRNCGAFRKTAPGICGTDENIRISKIMNHKWEEPPISGSLGSGCIFFTGCSLKCVYCQNSEISRGEGGRIYSQSELLEEILSMEESVHNINLVTGTHMTDYLIPVLEELKRRNFSLPIIWNTSSYENKKTLEKLGGLIDVYLADFKYLDRNSAGKYSGAPDYPQVALKALKEMYRQRGKFVLNDGLIKSGIVARHLVLPGCAEDSMDIIDRLNDEFGNDIIYSIMMQYTPKNIPSSCSEINRRVSEEEYDRILNFTMALGLENVFIQEPESASEDFIPGFSEDKNI